MLAYNARQLIPIIQHRATVTNTSVQSNKIISFRAIFRCSSEYPNNHFSLANCSAELVLSVSIELDSVGILVEYFSNSLEEWYYSRFSSLCWRSSANLTCSRRINLKNPVFRSHFKPKMSGIHRKTGFLGNS